MTAIVVKPPVARKEPNPTHLHGQTLEDDYGWMRQKESPEVIAYLEAENEYTDAAMAETKELQQHLYKEMLSHIKETDESVPYPDRGWFYYTRTMEGASTRSTAGGWRPGRGLKRPRRRRCCST